MSRPAACARSESTDPAARWCSKCWRYKDDQHTCPERKPGESLHAWRTRNQKGSRK